MQAAIASIESAQVLIGQQDVLNLLHEHGKIPETNILNIYYFGSRVHGTQSASADYDFLIVLAEWNGDDHIVVPPSSHRNIYFSI